jgi:hypothetical protein
MNQEISLKSEEVLIEERDGLGLIILNRPKALNALSLEMIRQIAAALQRWENDATIKSVLFTGAGDRAFCAGGDLKIFHRAGMEVRKGSAQGQVLAQGSRCILRGGIQSGPPDFSLPETYGRIHEWNYDGWGVWHCGKLPAQDYNTKNIIRDAGNGHRIFS